MLLGNSLFVKYDRGLAGGCTMSMTYEIAMNVTPIERLCRLIGTRVGKS